MSGRIRVALLGLGRVGEVFAEHFLAQIQERRAPVEIGLGEEVDIIFDLTGDVQMRKALRRRLQATNNAHTIVASEMMANLLWCFFNDAPELPGQTRPGRGY